jgi:hypothetical protein
VIVSEFDEIQATNVVVQRPPDTALKVCERLHLVKSAVTVVELVSKGRRDIDAERAYTAMEMLGHGEVQSPGTGDRGPNMGL